MDMTNEDFLNFFNGVINNGGDNSKVIKQDLDDYWKHSKVDKYWDLYHRSQDKYIIQRNSDGRHNVIRK